MNANNFVSSSSSSRSFWREKMVETCLWLLNMFLCNFYLQVAWTLHHPREIRPPFRQHSRHCPRNYLPGCKLHILKNSTDALAGYFWTWIWLLRSWVREWLLKFNCNEYCSRCSQTISCGKSGSRSMNVNLSIISEFVV